MIRPHLFNGRVVQSQPAASLVSVGEFVMNSEIDPKGLTCLIKPTVMIDDYQADVLMVSLSPEIPLSCFSLKQCFDGVLFKNGSKAEWVRQLREIADSLES